MKIFFLIILTSLNVFIIGNIKAEKFDFNKFFERKRIHKKCMADENNRLIYGRNRNKYCNCYVDKISKEAPDDEKFLSSIEEAWYIQRLRFNRLTCMMEMSGIKVD